MSLYYAKGSAFANNFIGVQRAPTERHFGDEWRETQPVSQYLAYAASVLLTDSSALFGGHGHWLKIHKADESGRIVLNRGETLASFRRGEIAYKPTPIGGCVSTGPCDRTPIDILSVDCLGTDCKNLIASVEKVEKIIRVKTNKIQRLKNIDPELAEIRIEEAELKVLEASLQRASMNR